VGACFIALVSSFKVLLVSLILIVLFCNMLLEPAYAFIAQSHVRSPGMSLFEGLVFVHATVLQIVGFPSFFLQSFV
jgi:hypothetical protein